MDTWYVMFLILFDAFGLFENWDTCLYFFSTDSIRAFTEFAHGFKLVSGIVEYLGISMLLIDSINLRIALGVFQCSIYSLNLHREVELRIVLSKHIKLLVQGGKGLGQARHHDQFSLSLGCFDIEIFLDRICGLLQGLQNFWEVVKKLLFLFELL